MTNEGELVYEEILDSLLRQINDSTARAFADGVQEGIDFAKAVFREEYDLLVNGERNGNAAYGIGRAIERLEKVEKWKVTR